MVCTLHEPDWTEEAALEESDLRLTYLTVVPLPSESDLEHADCRNGAFGIELTCFGIVLVLGALAVVSWNWAW